MKPVVPPSDLQVASDHRLRERVTQYLIGLGLAKSVLLITVMSVVGSWLIMLISHLAANLALGHGLSSTSFIIGTITPALVAPGVSVYFVHILHELEKARHQAYTLAVTDALTGVYNRRYFMGQAEAEFAKSLRYKTPVSIIMMDVDHFKSVNDTYGHDGGDNVLKAISHAASESVRGQDILARFGGEEFIVLLPQTGGDEALLVAERIRHEIGVQQVQHGDQTIQVTASLGVATLTKNVSSLSALLKRADEALYRCKAEGRNRCILASD